MWNWKNEKFIFTEKFSWNHLFSDLSSIYTYFAFVFSKIVRVNLRNFHTVKLPIPPLTSYKTSSVPAKTTSKGLSILAEQFLRKTWSRHKWTFWELIWRNFSKVAIISLHRRISCLPYFAWKQLANVESVKTRRGVFNETVMSVLSTLLIWF